MVIDPASFYIYQMVLETVVYLKQLQLGYNPAL